jgi:precorrin-2 dehydrogenase/sirohydrochlorin ferrochelatase
MIPLYLDPQRARIALIGTGSLCVRRLQWLLKLDARPVVFSDAPSAELREAAGFLLAKRLPEREEIRAFHAIWIADLEPEQARQLSELARDEGVLVNTEDMKPLSNFHTPAIVKRGKLVLAAGTGGASPAAASLVRERLEQLFPEHWEALLEELAQARESLRRSGADLRTISEDARARVRAHLETAA